MEGVKCRIIHLASRFIRMFIQFCLHCPALSRSGVTHARGHGFEGLPRSSAPVHADRTESRVCDRIPLARARREVTHMNGQTGLIGESLGLRLEQPGPITITATAVGGDRQRGRLGILVLTDEIPPTPDARQGKFWRVMMGADIHQRVVCGYIIDSIGAGFPFRPIRKIINIDAGGTVLRGPFSTRLAKVPYSLFFLGIHRNHGLSRLLKGLSLIMNPRELIVPIRMVDGSFVDFPRALYTIALIMQEGGDSARTDGMAVSL